MAAAADVETDETVEQAPSVSNDLEDATEVSIEALSKDFATLFCVETSRKTGGMEATTDDILARLDEYYQLVERIHQESEAAFEQTLPALQAQCDELTAVFRSIDQLEAFIAVVRENVTELEKKVALADKELSVNPIKRAFQKVELPAFLKRRTGFGSKVLQQPHSDKKWQRPDIFQTDDYLGKPS
ncbi:uncharacterized protein LOC134177898 [Corticium candelabrum]|uniref:uncharacterized protein LOC134177898 n=1 Tax=Corticium candelabrum TaxID=121492 RepID=UPI002E26277E|nr:uncharacterized protein LOC134177898 [Corticium candelabrum]